MTVCSRIFVTPSGRRIDVALYCERKGPVLWVHRWRESACPFGVTVSLWPFHLVVAVLPDRYVPADASTGQTGQEVRP